MDVRYEPYCFTDPHFYDTPTRIDPAKGPTFACTNKILPKNWKKSEEGIWTIVTPVDYPMRTQGWKIHVSATPDNAESILSQVWDYCISAGICFKFLCNHLMLLHRNSKYAPREASGKLVTIYPIDDSQLQRILTDLSSLLATTDGPYILSDLRCAPGPLYVRYGGFLERLAPNENGVLVPAIERPDGTLVPDKRRPVFTVPDWVTAPDFMLPHLEQRNAGDPADFAYDCHRSLHFSNGGGVYLATRKMDGTQAVLKEARPFAGLDKGGSDAVRRLAQEWHILGLLNGIEGVPAAYEYFTAWEHHFLSMQYMPGIPLGRWLAGQYPLTKSHPTARHIADYTARALRIIERVERLVRRIHERGVVISDLHPGNLLIDENDSVALIDFELAFELVTPRRPALGAAGFAAPSDRVGTGIDDYALAALRLWFFVPLTQMLALAPGKLTHYVTFASQRFALPRGYTGPIVREISSGRSELLRTELDEPEPQWAAVRKSVAEAILLSATPEREDRLFPGDISQFTIDGICFGYGAAGVLYALSVTGAGRYPQYEQWLLDTIRRRPPRRPGFYDGGHGIAHVLENFGHHEAASELLDRFPPDVATIHDHSLGGGLAGIGLNLLHFATTRQDREYRELAIRLGDRLAQTLPSTAAPQKSARAGLLRGWSGPALLFVRLFEHTMDRRWLTLADQALLLDLAETVPTADGSAQVRDGGRRTLPYLETGSAGVALVIEELLAHVAQPESARQLSALHRACHPEFVAFPGLFSGRAGLLATLARSLRRRPDAEVRQVVSRHLDRLAWHAVPYRGHIAFPGSQLLRLSMDLATGNAGVLLALAATTENSATLTFLPFL